MPTSLPDNIVQLSDSPENRNGKRYTPEDKAAAYECWRTFGARSLRKVSELTGIAVSTLGTWSQAEGWVKRAAEDAKHERKSVLTSIETIVSNQRIEAIERMIDIAKDAQTPTRDKIAANIWLAGIGGVVPVQRSEVRHQHVDEDEDTPRAATMLDLTPDQLAERLARLRDEPIEDAG